MHLASLSEDAEVVDIHCQCDWRAAMVKKRKACSKDTTDEYPSTAAVEHKQKGKKRKVEENEINEDDAQTVAAATPSDVDAAERLRRALQRDIQQLVLRSVCSVLSLLSWMYVEVEPYNDCQLQASK